MITAKNERELLDILKLVCEEASSAAFESLNDPAVSKYQSQFVKDEKLLGNLSEEEEQELEEPSEEEEEEETSPEEEVPAEEAPSTEEAPEEFGVSFDSVISAINALRSGRSLRDSSIKQQALDYYDRLDQGERKVLLLFISSLSDILTGEVEGSAAVDPSDPPHSATISMGGDEEPQSPPPASPDDLESSAEEEEEEETPPEEDTTPPIRVNESQDVTVLRRKIRRLML